MGAAALISEEDYLRTSYEVECEFADGVLRVPDTPIEVPLRRLDSE